MTDRAKRSEDVEAGDSLLHLGTVTHAADPDGDDSIRLETADGMAHRIAVGGVVWVRKKSKKT